MAVYGTPIICQVSYKANAHFVPNCFPQVSEVGISITTLQMKKDSKIFNDFLTFL